MVDDSVGDDGTEDGSREPTDTTGPTRTGTPDEPLGDLTRRIRERGGRGGDGDSGEDTASANSGHGEFEGDVFDELGDAAGEESVVDEDADELFETMDVDDVDAEQVWGTVLDDADPAPTESTRSDDRIESTDDGDGYVVPKHDYCESCQFFTAPPEVGCTYEGSTIVEIVDSEQFRVRNCPVVAGRVDPDGSVLEGIDATTVDDIE